MRDFEERRRARVAGGRTGTLIGFSVLGGALLLVLMIVLGSVDPPRADGPAAALPSVGPTPSPASAADRLYVVGQRIIGADYRELQHVIRAYDLDAPRPASVATFPGGLDTLLSPDGTRLFILQPAMVQAIDVASGEEAWHALLTAPFSATNGLQTDGLLALSPDGATLGLYRPGARFGGRDGEIERFDARGGAILPPLQVSNVFNFTRLLIGAGGDFLVVTTNAVIRIDPASGAQQRIIEEPGTSSLVVALDAAGETLFIATPSELLTVRAAPDSPVRRQTLQLGLEGAAYSFQALAVAPAGDRLALHLYVSGQPEIADGRMSSGPSSSRMVALNPQDGAITGEIALTSFVYGSSMSFSGDGSLLYYLDQNGIGAWEIASGKRWSVVAVSDNGSYFAERLIRGPLAPIQPGSLAARTLGQLPAPPTATPQPIPTAQVQAEPAPFAWIWQNQAGSAQVVEYAADGSSQLIADDVLAAVERPDRPPLLITAPESSAWVVLDPLAGSATPISIAVHLGRTQISADRLALAPAGDQLALITERDPIAGDDLAAGRQVVVVDLASGQARALLEIPGRVSSNPQIFWGESGLYLLETRALPGGNRPVAVLRLDPAAERPAPEEVVAFDEDGAYIAFNPQAGLLVYQPHPEDLESSTLFVRNLRTGEENIIYAGAFIDYDAFLISPDGAHVAYLAPVDRPDAAPDTLALHIYSVADGTTVRPNEGGRAYQGHRLRWTADSSAVLYQSFRYSPEQRLGLLIEHRIGADGQILGEIGMAIPVFYSAANTRRWSADETTLVELSDQERYALLRLSDRAGNTLVALPLDLQVVRNLGASAPSATFQPIVYVFGDQ